MKARVLVVDDDRNMCELVEAGLTRRGCQVEWRTRALDALDLLEERDFDVVLTDLKLDDLNGIALTERVLGSRPDLPVVVMTAFGSMDAAVSCLRVGAYDFITKPIEMEALAAAVMRASQHRRLSEEVRRLREEVEDVRGAGEMVGESPAMRRVYDLVNRISGSDATVLITGESGTGKELVARALHRKSERGKGSFVAINCAAMPANLLESELFGHMKGAFTDAKRSREGLFIEASGGTLFLDEIGEMAPEMQAKLLRSLQERRVRPVGGAQEIPFDTRIVAATNRDLDADVEDGRFREDLYYRINVVRIDVPPLRLRGNDTLMLAQHFIDRIRKRSGKGVEGISSQAAQKLLEYDWPGNVRELENCMERACALARFDQVTVDDLPEKIRAYQSSHMVIASDDPADLPTLEDLERRYIQRVLKAVAGNKTQAARVLGVDRRTLYRKLERWSGHAHVN
jgi:DNA-binding NtrC family response regulator